MHMQRIGIGRTILKWKIPVVIRRSMMTSPSNWCTTLRVKTCVLYWEVDERAFVTKQLKTKKTKMVIDLTVVI